MSKNVPAARSPSAKRGSEYILLGVPSALALLLVIPGFAFTYFFDDYDFLARAQTIRWGDLLPDPQSLFYRPISRELYFSIIKLLGPAGLLGGHVLNALLFGLAVALLGRFTRELAGPRAGLLAGLAFAVLGQMPLLAGWISGDQDLLAICFILAAFNLRIRDRRMLAFVAIILAILSKETAIAFVPILLGLDILLGRRTRGYVGEVAPYAVLLLVWAGIHPGIRALLTPPTGLSSPSYISLAQPNLLSSLAKTAATVSNLPLTGPSTPWPSQLSLIMSAGALMSVLGILWIGKERFPKSGDSLPSGARVAVLGISMIALPSLLTSLVVRDWLPYYACIPALGSSLMFGLALRRSPSAAAATSVVALLALGIWCRGMMIDPTITSERTLAGTSVALRQVESGFKKLWPAFPRNSSVYVSTQVSGMQNVYVHMNRFQPLRVWYRDPTVLTLAPRRRATASGPEFLAWISPTLDVFGIDPMSLEPRSSGPKPRLQEYQSALRSYARGLADAGQTSRAVQVIVEIPQVDSVSWGLDCRDAAIYLLADGRDSEALQVLSTAPPIDSMRAVSEVAEMMLDRSATRNLDPFMLRAFGIRGTLADLYRRYMRFFDDHENPDATRAFARKLQAVAPGDRESANVLGRLGPGRHEDRVTTHR